MSQLAERFEAAVLKLVGDGPVKERLTHAYADHLEGVAETELPMALREPFAQLTAALHRLPPLGEENRVRANVRKMSPAEAAAHAAVIVKLYAGLTQQDERAEPLKVVASTGKAPPRYLTRP